jgi:4-hydroxybenzoate polyprenyltransferase
LIGALLKSLRPKQWTKNALVFAGYIFTIDLPHPPDTLWRVLAAVGLFCAVSGATYILNDAVDVEADRKHPKKCKRPIASGAVSVRVAVAFALVLLVAAMAASHLLDFYFGLLVSAYLLLTLSYSAVLKHVVIVDLLTISAGFVLRAVAGAVVVKAIDPVTHAAYRVEISPWLLVCTTLLALFLGLAKRRGELIMLENGGADHRKTLSEYSAPMLDQMLTISSSCALMAYFLYTFTPGSKTGTSHPYMMITIPFVIYGLFRYLFLVHDRNAGGSPEQVLLEDKPLLINCILYVIAAVVALKL